MATEITASSIAMNAEVCSFALLKFLDGLNKLNLITRQQNLLPKAHYTLRAFCMGFRVVEF